MGVFACRWPNGDVSFVMARNKEQAIEELDEVGNAEGCPLYKMPDFQIHLRLTDDGQFDFEGWGEATEDAVLTDLYPVLDEARSQVAMGSDDEGAVEEQREMIRQAVREERTRVESEAVAEPETARGTTIKRLTNMPTTLVNRIVRNTAKQQLKQFRSKGKPQ